MIQAVYHSVLTEDLLCAITKALHREGPCREGPAQQGSSGVDSLNGLA